MMVVWEGKIEFDFTAFDNEGKAKEFISHWAKKIMEHPNTDGISVFLKRRDWIEFAVCDERRIT
jgi:hypothetical protein